MSGEGRMGKKYGERSCIFYEPGAGSDLGLGTLVVSFLS